MTPGTGRRTLNTPPPGPRNGGDRRFGPVTSTSGVDVRLAGLQYSDRLTQDPNRPTRTPHRIAQLQTPRARAPSVLTLAGCRGRFLTPAVPERERDEKEAPQLGRGDRDARVRPPRHRRAGPARGGGRRPRPRRRPARTASSFTQDKFAANVTDGNVATYWESENNAFPQWVQVDLGAAVAVNQVILQAAADVWDTRTQTLSVRAAPTGRPSATSPRPPATRSTRPPATPSRSASPPTTDPVRPGHVTANPGWPAGPARPSSRCTGRPRRHRRADRARQPRLHPAGRGHDPAHLDRVHRQRRRHRLRRVSPTARCSPASAPS